MTATSSQPFADMAPIDATDAELRAILDDAALAPLLPAIAYATGDLSLLRDDLRPDPLLMNVAQQGFTPEQAAEIRQLALDALVRFRDSGSTPVAPPDDATVLRIMEHAVAGAGMEAYLPLLEEELAYKGDDRRGPRFRADELAPDRELHVLVIGAGMSGILTGYRLGQAGIAYTIVDKNDGIGGTWWENTYPGCRVDNPNHNYSYSIAQRHDWPFHYSTQGVLRDYFNDCADAFGVREHVQLRTEVLSAVWSDDDLRWSVTLRRDDGREEIVVADAVVSAVGQLNRPKMPDIPGVGRFQGPAFHSARWDDTVELAGKRVAVIGTGASAMQLIPEIAPIVGHLDVYQRTPAWLAPTEDYHAPVAEGLRWLYRHVPSYSEFHRFCIFWQMGDGAIEGVRVLDGWDPGDGGSVGPMNEMVRQLLTQYIKEAFADRPDLAEACTPRYPPGAKRIVRDNGVWPGALMRENVSLITTGIREITETGVVTADGVAHDVDVIIYGTGFQASDFLTPMKVVGRGGLDLHEQWKGDARAYLGVTIPGFPNLFCLYGPNTNIVINGSIIYFSECGVRYILGLLELLLATGSGAAEVRRDVHDAFNEAVDAENARMAWGASDVSSWYKNAHGHVAQNWPFTLLEYWDRTRQPDPGDYLLTPLPR